MAKRKRTNKGYQYIDPETGSPIKGFDTEKGTVTTELGTHKIHPRQKSTTDNKGVDKGEMGKKWNEIFPK